MTNPNLRHFLNTTVPMKGNTEFQQSIDQTFHQSQYQPHQATDFSPYFLS